LLDFSLATLPAPGALFIAEFLSHSFPGEFLWIDFAYYFAIGTQASFKFSGSETDNIQIGNSGFPAITEPCASEPMAIKPHFYAARIYGISGGNNDAIPS
jgi:hypothetical protein